MSQLLFLDLKEAYNQVDRDILYQKLMQLNFPTTFVEFLWDYYRVDFIVCSLAGPLTWWLYLVRGLRQGCNLSAILVILYLSELGNRLRCAGLGVEMVDSILLSFPKFADNIILFAHSWPNIIVLVCVLEQWCRDFRMVVSVMKTKVASPSPSLVWRILNLESGLHEKVECLCPISSILVSSSNTELL